MEPTLGVFSSDPYPRILGSPPNGSRVPILCQVLPSYSTVMTTFPFLCPLSTYRWASTICSSGYDLSMTGFISPASISSLSDFRNSGKIIHSWFLLKKKWLSPPQSQEDEKYLPGQELFPRLPFGQVVVCPFAPGLLQLVPAYTSSG